MLILLESTLFQGFRIFGTMPDLAGLIVILLGLYNGPWEGALFGIAAGIMTGFFSSGYAFIFCIAYGIAGFLSGQVKDRLFPDSFVVPAITSMIITVISSLIITLLGLMSGIISTFYTFTAHIIPLVIMQGALSIPLGYLVRTGIISPKVMLPGSLYLDG